METVRGPFIGTEALAAQRVSRRGLRRDYRAIYRNVYLAHDQQVTALNRAGAAWLWSGRKSTAAGLSAAALLGSQWIDPQLPAELYRRNGKPVGGIVIHRDELWDDEVRVVRGVSATTPARTAFDLGRRRGLTTAVIRVDALANATRCKRVEVEELVPRHRGVRGLVQLGQVLELMDGGAESPQETRTRLVLVQSGLPSPQTQVVVVDHFGEPFARIDMAYEEWKVGIEYDGAQHWTDPAQRAYDIDRHAELLRCGWRVVRVSADMLRYRPEVIVARVCAALREAGAQWPVIARFVLDCVS